MERGKMMLLEMILGMVTGESIFDVIRCLIEITRLDKAHRIRLTRGWLIYFRPQLFDKINDYHQRV